MEIDSKVYWPVATVTNGLVTGLVVTGTVDSGWSMNLDDSPEY